MKPRRLAVIQSSYVPWKGFFDFVNSVDEFVLYDDVEFSKGSFRNRNKIKTASGLSWLTIPVNVTLGMPIKDVTIAKKDWGKRHWDQLHNAYRKAPHFDEIAALVKPLYDRDDWPTLTAVNLAFFELICNYLGVKTRTRMSMEFELVGDRVERLINLAKATGCQEYVSGPAAKAYLGSAEERLFEENGVALRYFDYGTYPPYEQLHPPFDHQVSILDLMFSCGKESTLYMRSFGQR